jgi:uncharacterized membrane protein YfcA
VSGLEVAAGLAVFAGAALQSAVGFGFALVCAPLVFAAFGPVQAIGLLTVLGLEINLVSLIGEGRRPHPVGRVVVTVLAWGLPGMVAGVVVLRNTSETVLQVVVTVVVLASLLAQRRAARLTLPAQPAGLLSGTLCTTTGTGGPPLVLLLLGRGLAPERVRDTLMTCFIGQALLAAAVLALTGTRSAAPEALALAALVPLAAAGQVAGRPLFRILSGGRYEAALTIVLVISAAVGLLAAVV